MPARSAKSKKASFVESPPDTEEDAPKHSDDEPPSSPSRRRASKGKRVVRNASNNDIASSPNTSERRAASNKSTTLTELDINDDAAERRRRRKSARVSFIPDENDDDEPSSRPQTPERDNAATGSRSGPIAGGSKGAAQLASVAHTPMPTLDVMSSNFEEWMKMATDNKINATNSWNFALIDYFHDMSLLRNTDDNSINFQKASFTLDGCVKIWTSRVDSVGTETGKLLSNLAVENGMAADDDDEEGGEGLDGEEGAKVKKRKAHRAEATLAKSYSQLQVKKLDLEFAVDPLFKKTSADFDEGGAMGLLMNHLGVDAKMRVVFDAGDSKLADEDEEEQEDHADVDLSELRLNFLPALDTLDERTIAQQLSEFKFSSDDLDLSFMEGEDAHNDGGALDDNSMFGADDSGGGGGGGEMEDFFTGDQAVDNDDGGGFGMGFDNDEDMDGTGMNTAGNMAGVARMEPFDPRRVPNERELVMVMNENDDQMLDYFDTNFMKNWAGPEHWKLRRAVKKPDENTVAAPKTRREKTKFQIPFLEPPEHTAKQLFTPAPKTSSILLSSRAGVSAPTTKGKGRGKKPAKEAAGKRDAHLLPDDMHFTSHQLLRLFLKPKFTLKMRRNIAGAGLNDNGDGEIDEHFWARANQAQSDDIDETEGGGAIPFNTQFFHDDFDEGPAFDDDDLDGGGPIGLGLGLGGADNTMDEEGDLLAATQGQLKRVRPEFVNYARRAKRVDVRKLKENIWKGLDIVVIPSPHDAENEDDRIEVEPTDPNDGRVFDSVIDGLRASYPKEKMEEISTSFCFICLLHLANERGLKIEVGESANDNEKGEDQSVGDIFGLKIYRDPTASASA